VGDLPWDLIDPRGMFYKPALGRVARDHGWFDQGGVAHGTGWMPKKTIKPERVLSPQQTQSFDKLVSLLERNGTVLRVARVRWCMSRGWSRLWTWTDSRSVPSSVTGKGSFS
jgi:hypothetical protein